MPYNSGRHNYAFQANFSFPHTNRAFSVLVILRFDISGRQKDQKDNSDHHLELQDIRGPKNWFR